MIKLFEDFKNKPDVNSVSNEFWKMVEIADWDAVIKGFKEHPIIDDEHKNFMKQAEFRIYNKYKFEEIKKFFVDYNFIYDKIYDYFQEIFYNGEFNVSDDSYSDLISSVIGKGKTWVNKCIEKYKLVKKMAKNDDFVENFAYILQPSENEYHKTRELFDPQYKDMRKYNLL